MRVIDHDWIVSEDEFIRLDEDNEIQLSIIGCAYISLNVTSITLRED